ncbi:hypothetical protein [Methylotenera sp.]|uniref:hypothetical protein n=1 Tax=Methylotenera sp. TaxID=2051956 RepID=UPI002734448C|nr:hypothetical protein [Methylotenera sp.]MDP3308278.1 hypothetical protein [Methylotenera sp.]
MMRERIIRLHYDDDALGFITDSHVHAFQQVLGRMLTFGIRSKENDGLEFVELCLNAAGEIVGDFYPASPWRIDGELADRAPFYALSTAIDAFKTEQPKTIGAAPDNTGEYIFH